MLARTACWKTPPGFISLPTKQVSA